LPDRDPPLIEVQAGCQRQPLVAAPPPAPGRSSSPFGVFGVFLQAPAPPRRPRPLVGGSPSESTDVSFGDRDGLFCPRSDVVSSNPATLSLVKSPACAGPALSLPPARPLSPQSSAQARPATPNPVLCMTSL
ncbi:hypothetical protein THAOC_24604, partial [Thalassiosira oceanica]